MSTKKRITTKYSGVFYRIAIDNEKTYYISYRTEDGKNKELKIGKYSEGVREAYCNQKRNEIITKQRLGEEPPLIAKKKKNNSQHAIDKIFNYYYENKKLHNRHIKADKASYDNHLKKVFGTTALERLTVEDIRKFQTMKIKSYAPKTVNNFTGQLSTIIEFYIQEGKIKIDNIVKRIKPLKIDNNREQYLTLKEIKKLYKAVEDDNELYVFTKLLLNTGARLQGVYNISFNHIDFSVKSMIIKDFKNDSTYRMFFNEELSTLLDERFRENKNKLFKRSQTQLQKLLAKKLNELFNLGLKIEDRKNRIVVHSLRHTFASHLAINETPIFTIQKLMNHRDISSTMRYAKSSRNAGENHINNLGKIGF